MCEGIRPERCACADAVCEPPSEQTKPQHEQEEGKVHSEVRCSWVNEGCGVKGDEIVSGYGGIGVTNGVSSGCFGEVMNR